MSEQSPIINVANAPVVHDEEGAWGGTWQVLTPSMRPRGGTLGVVQNRLRPGHVGCPFHTHLREDEVFFVLSGHGTLRYGDAVYAIGAGDCISCPAGTGTAHQIANTGDDDLVYLAIGPRDAHEVCTYPDSGKVFVRGLSTVGFMRKTEYMDGEPDPPRILAMK